MLLSPLTSFTQWPSTPPLATTSSLCIQESVPSFAAWAHLSQSPVPCCFSKLLLAVEFSKFCPWRERGGTHVSGLQCEGTLLFPGQSPRYLQITLPRCPPVSPRSLLLTQSTFQWLFTFSCPSEIQAPVTALCVHPVTLVTAAGRRRLGGQTWVAGASCTK